MPEATPAPTPPAAVPPEPSGPVATPSIVYPNPDDDLPPSLLWSSPSSPSSRSSRCSTRSRHAPGGSPARAAPAREAAFRLGGTWGDFSDWLRTGR